MVEVRLREGGVLESAEAEITYIKTAGDLGDITKINSSFSWTMKFPKSPNNTATLDGLGLVGSGSRKPYEKIYCDLTDNGLPIAINALLNIRETSNHYDIFIQEGFVDFIRDVQNDNISDIGVEELDHIRTVENISDSFTLDKPYAYLIGDVNGAYLPNISGTTNLDPRYMSPFANVGYIWDRIFSRYNWSYEISEEIINSIRGTWMSLPQEIEIENAEVINAGSLSAEDTEGEHQIDLPATARYKIPLPDRTLNNQYLLPQVVGDLNFVIQQDGNYNISIFAEGIFNLLTLTGPRQRGFNIGLWIGGEFISSLGGENNDGTVISFQRSLRAGDVIALGASADRLSAVPVYTSSLDIYSAGMNVDYLNPEGNIGDVSFSKSLIDLKVSDFIKEIMVRESLTAFVDNENRNIKFLSLDQRFDQDIEIWTDRFVRRKSEGYLYNSYAQNNLLKHKYEDDVSQYSDGSLFVDNQNLENEKTLYTSLGHAPERGLSVFSDNGQNYNVPRTKMFEVEVERRGDDLVGEYSFLKDRFFFVKSRISNRSIYISGNLFQNIPLVSTHDSTFNNIVSEKYSKFINLSLSAKVHKIDLALSISDIVGLNLYAIYYFEQEASYYFLNSLSYKTGNITTGEFIKFNPNQRMRAFSDGFSNAFNI